MLENIGSLVNQYGLMGIFVASFIGNVIPYSAVPYVAFILAYSAISNVESYFVVSLAGGAGATVGKITIFLVSRLGRKKLSKEVRENAEYFLALMKKKYIGFLIIVLFALTPLPDDVIYVPLGIAGYAFLNFILAVFIGKFFLVLMVTFLGKSAYSILEFSTNSNYLWLAIVGLIVATFYIILIVFYTDWKKIIVTLSDRGVKAALYVFLVEMLLVITFKHENIRKRFFKKKED
ncbi:MAG: DedA family protein [Fervidicoccaceae archaeon]